MLADGVWNASGEELPVHRRLGKNWPVPWWNKDYKDYKEGSCQERESWDTGLRNTECEHIASSAKVYLSLPAHLKILALQDEFSKTEFMAYLVGTKDKDSFSIEDIFVPKQEVSGASALALEFPKGDGILGTVHSHGTMSLSEFSSIDEASILGNHNLNLLVLGNGKYNARIRQKLPCGRLGSMRATVTISMPEVVDLSAFVADARKKVKVGVRAGVQYYDGERWQHGQW